ncbi:PIG-L family deacetylase [Streptomyces kanasensis]|uniref:PIG-L family deacetylase n=1 Tax=Streptomyces kanasensis TaxID=936756 RepID=UPI0036FA5B68
MPTFPLFSSGSLLDLPKGASVSRPVRLLPRRAALAAGSLAVLAGVTSGALLLAGGASTASDVPSRGVPEEVAVKPVRTDGGAVMQIVSHPDDDLFFMNPDTARTIAAGRSLTSVYLTAGESDGRNARSQDPQPPADKAAYAEARQNGIRAAYAEMATGNRTSPWDRTAVTTAGGARAELDTLRARPGVSLVWVQLREAGSVAGDRPDSLRGLWDGRVPELGSQLAAGSPVRDGFAYTKDEVVATVAGLLERFRPTFVRTLDPTPGVRDGDGALSDHQDHMYGARFAQAALERYARTPGHPATGVQTYLGYATGGLPHSLDPATAREKLRSLETYAWLDLEDHCGDPAGCGDRKVAARPAGRDWAQSIRYTRGESTSWLRRDGDGTLYAFGVLDGRLAVWRKPVGAAWTGPLLLPGGGLDGSVTTVALPDGRVAAFGSRTRLDPYRREVGYVVQGAPGGPFGPWRSLGTPEPDDAAGTSDISRPAVLVDRAGALSVFVRDARHRLTVTSGTAGGDWSGWAVAGGSGVHGDPVAVADAAGRGYVFAATADSVLAWTRGAGGGTPTGPVATGLPATTVALGAAPDGDGVGLWFRRPDSGDVRVARFAAGSGRPSAVRDVPGSGGYGAVSAEGGRLAARGRAGGLATAPAARGGAWSTAGPLFAGAPAGVADGVAVVGLDGRLLWTATGGPTRIGP